MLKILERYLMKTVMSATLVTTAAITAVLFVMTLLGEFRDLGEGDYGLLAVFTYALMRMPNALYQFSPMLMLLGSIIGLSLLAMSRELNVMRASGFSVKRIISSVFLAALIMIAAFTIIGEVYGPGLNHRAVMRKDNLQNAGQAVVTTSGVWLHVNNHFIHIEHVIGKHLLEGVTQYLFDNDHRLLASYYAKSVRNVDGEWVMHDVVKTSFHANRTMSDKYSELKWDMKFNKNLLNTGMQEPEEMSLPKLAKYSRYLEQNGLQSSQYRFEFWQRLLTPLSALMMIFLAVPFVLGSFERMPMGFRLMIGVLTGFAFFILNAFFGQLCMVYQVPAFFAAVIPLIVFGVIGLFMAKNLIMT